MQRLSPDLIVQAVATFGIKRSHINSTAALIGLRKGTLRECSPHSIPINNVTLRKPSHPNG